MGPCVVKNAQLAEVAEPSYYLVSLYFLLIKSRKCQFFGHNNMGKKVDSLLECSNWIFDQGKVFEATLQRAVLLFQVCDHTLL